MTKQLTVGRLRDGGYKVIHSPEVSIQTQRASIKEFRKDPTNSEYEAIEVYSDPLATVKLKAPPPSEKKGKR